jgi:hypothetical protein
VIAGPDMDQATRADLAAYAGCIAGALTEDEFREGLEAAGFAEIEIRQTHRVHEHASSAIIRARKPDPTAVPAFPPTPTTESQPMTLLDITTRVHGRDRRVQRVHSGSGRAAGNVRV